MDHPATPGLSATPALATRVAIDVPLHLATRPASSSDSRPAAASYARRAPDIGSSSTNCLQHVRASFLLFSVSVFLASQTSFNLYLLALPAAFRSLSL